MILDQVDEPKIVYGESFIRYLTYVWNTRISYADEEIYLFDDDGRNAFRHAKHHPDIVSEFSYIIKNSLFIPMGGTFSSVISPSDFKPFTRARVPLAET